MTSIIDSSRLETRVRQNRTYSYDPARKLFLNPETDKWVQNPVSRRKFIVSSKMGYYQKDAHPILEDIARNTAEIESIQYYLKSLATKSNLSVRKNGRSIWDLPEDETPFVWMHSELAIRVLGYNYLSILGKLERNGIIKSMLKPTIRYRRPFPLYRFAEKSFLTDYTLEPITCGTVDEKINGYLKWSQGYYTEEDFRMACHVVDNFPTIDMTHTLFKQVWDARYWEKKLCRYTDEMLDYQGYIEKGEQCWKIIEAWNTSDRDEKLAMFNPHDDFGHRFHYVHTYLPSECRAFTLDRNGQPVNLTSCDVKNCQPMILGNLLMTRFNLDPEETEFIRLIGHQVIYEDLSYRLHMTRNEAKPLMLQYMYCQAHKPAQKEFEEYYGEPALIVHEYKTLEMDENCRYVEPKNRHKILPRMMQREESKIFREIKRELLKLGFKVLPVHDAVYVADCGKSETTYVKRVMDAVLQKHLRINFKVEQEAVTRGNVMKQLGIIKE